VPSPTQICVELEHGDIAGALVDEAACDPTGLLYKVRDFFPRREENVIPRSRVLSVANPEALYAAHLSA
jgi:hypothetical protein